MKLLNTLSFFTILWLLLATSQLPSSISYFSPIITLVFMSHWQIKNTVVLGSLMFWFVGFVFDILLFAKLGTNSIGFLLAYFFLVILKNRVNFLGSLTKFLLVFISGFGYLLSQYILHRHVLGVSTAGNSLFSQLLSLIVFSLALSLLFRNNQRKTLKA